MATELTRVSVKTEEDLLKLHELCMLLGRWAGLPVPERIRFSAGIATHSNPYNSEVIQVCFSIEEKMIRPALYQTPKSFQKYPKAYPSTGH